jgi:hypothetical protein
MATACCPRRWRGFASPPPPCPWRAKTVPRRDEWQAAPWHTWHADTGGERDGSVPQSCGLVVCLKVAHSPGMHTARRSEKRNVTRGRGAQDPAWFSFESNACVMAADLQEATPPAEGLPSVTLRGRAPGCVQACSRTSQILKLSYIGSAQRLSRVSTACDRIAQWS